MYEAWFDASVRRRRVAVAGVIAKDGQVIDMFAETIPFHPSSCRAEYVAFIQLVLRLRKLGISEVTIYGDAMVVVTQVKGHPVQPDRPLARYHQNAVKLLSDIPAWRMAWVPRRENKLADRLCRIGV